MQPFNVCWSLTTWMVQLALIVLTVHAQNCIKPIGGPNMVLSDAFITQETFVDGEKVTFQCVIGYSSAGGSRSVTCTAGVWSDVKLTCERKSCGSPGEVMNGQFEISEGILFGNKVVATCDTGYMLVGSSGRTCMDGGWDGRVPVCEVVKCGKPPTIVNGGFVVPPEETYNYGSVVQYDCETDYTLVGSKSITCSENGEFQPAPPECKALLNTTKPPTTTTTTTTTTTAATTKRTIVHDRVPDPTHTIPDPNNHAGKIAGGVVGVLVPSLLLYFSLLLLH